MRNLSYENEFCTQFRFHANQSHFHKNSFALRLALKQRYKETRKWPIICTSRCKEITKDSRSASLTASSLVLSTVITVWNTGCNRVLTTRYTSSSIGPFYMSGKHFCQLWKVPTINKELTACNKTWPWKMSLSIRLWCITFDILTFNII